MAFENISPYFSRLEFACQCGCGFDTVDVSTLSILDAVREHFGPVVVTSGCRCEQHNARIGGAPGSQHKLARAADIKVSSAEPRVVYDWIAEQFPHASLGLYDSFVHVDTRYDGPARWDLRSEA
jgi:uncharacterized protein YcbK (DUF882 family)